LPQVKRLNHLIKTQWHQFVDDLDDSWKKDGWVEDRAPLGVISLHGQNLPVVTSGPNAALEAAAWESARDYKLARYLSYASATHYKYVVLLYANKLSS
jgi:hypothetical protein